MPTLNEFDLVMIVDCLTATRSDEIFMHGLKHDINCACVKGNKTPCQNDGNLLAIETFDCA